MPMWWSLPAIAQCDRSGLSHLVEAQAPSSDIDDWCRGEGLGPSAVDHRGPRGPAEALMGTDVVVVRHEAVQLTLELVSWS